MKPAPHELSASVELIKDKGLITGRYTWKYWSKKVKDSGVSFNKMQWLLKEMDKLPDKYSKGGWLTNQLQ